jgi:hypothetical protein
MYRVVSSYAAAARYHFWCDRHSDRSVVTECTFDTHAQCLATVSGVDGSCIVGASAEALSRQGA